MKVINNSNALNLLIEIKLSINAKLYKKGCITEEMYIRAREMIIKAV